MKPVEPQIPRFMKWNVNELHAKLVGTPVNTFSPEMVIDSQLQPTDEERRLFQILVTDETEEKHTEIPVDKPTVDEQAPKEDVQLLISELRKQIHLLESENNGLKHEIAERDIREKQKDTNIGRLFHLVDTLRRRIERYGEEAAVYEEIEQENISVHSKAQKLEERVQLPIWIDIDMQDTITLQDAITILNEGDVENTLIDGFTSMLARDDGLPINVIYFKSTLWSLLKDDKNQIREKFLDDKLREVNDNLDIFEYLVFPMNSSGGIAATENNPYHWTRLVLDIQHGDWKHYNSMKPRKNSQDLFLNDATLMSSCLYSVDCGIIVCYIIEKLAKAEAIPENLSKVEISEFRVSLLRRFLNDGDRSVAAKACRDHWAAEQPKAR
ncbi:hypothetical protein Vadar_013575 [Vaccinium darrowii]|uniref:Uncharacterized protein n=1 Tax=Vaccinium darrowii TaxID=229202 RepID=A0ACB7XQJ3_9ERIC|nr:hypothetical protein Vadar_013575 [Vaccinium darrowii]